LVGGRDGDVLGNTAGGDVARPEDTLVSIGSATGSDSLFNLASGLVASVLCALVGSRDADRGGDTS
jgi:hypothetical protein